jgi:hypothetical protein
LNHAFIMMVVWTNFSHGTMAKYVSVAKSKKKFSDIFFLLFLAGMKKYILFRELDLLHWVMAVNFFCERELYVYTFNNKIRWELFQQFFLLKYTALDAKRSEWKLLQKKHFWFGTRGNYIELLVVIKSAISCFNSKCHITLRAGE